MSQDDFPADTPEWFKHSVVHAFAPILQQLDSINDKLESIQGSLNGILQITDKIERVYTIDQFRTLIKQALDDAGFEYVTMDDVNIGSRHEFTVFESSFANTRNDWHWHPWECKMECVGGYSSTMNQYSSMTNQYSLVTNQYKMISPDRLSSKIMELIDQIVHLCPERKIARLNVDIYSTRNGDRAIEYGYVALTCV
jgi:hypothetical protein